MAESGGKPFDELSSDIPLSGLGQAPAEDTVREPDDPATWRERLKDVDYNDHKAAVLAIGAAAVALGVGVYTLSKKHGEKQIRIGYGDRRMQAGGIISLVERTRQGGAAVSAATSAAALEALGQTKDIFGMDDDEGISYPLERATDKSKHTKVLKKFGGWMMDVYAVRASKGQSNSQE